MTGEFDHRGNCVRSVTAHYAEKINPGTCVTVNQLSSMGVTMAGKEQDCAPEISRCFSGADKLFPRNQFLRKPPAFLAGETEVSSAVSSEGSGPFLRAGKVLVPSQCDTLSVVLLTAEQEGLLRFFLSCRSVMFRAIVHCGHTV